MVLELRALDVHAELRDDAEALAVEVIDDSGDEPLVLFAYGVQLRSYRTMTFTVLEPQKEAARRHWYAEAWCSTTGERYDVMGVDRHALIDDLLSHYSRWGGPDRASAGARAPAGLVPGPRPPDRRRGGSPYLSAQRTGGQDALGPG